MSNISPQGEQSTATEITALANLTALANSGASQAIKKTGATTFENTDVGSGSGGGTWGSITGTLSNQTDLQAELDTKIESRLTILTVTGTIDDSNTTFTLTSEPTVLVINGGVYKQTGGAITWTWTLGTLTAELSSPIGTGGNIFGLV